MPKSTKSSGAVDQPRLFGLRLATYSIEDGAVMDVAGVSASGGSGRKVVLVVDDEPMVRMFAVDLFEEMGCEVIEAGSGPEALAALEHRPDISLMFTDCRMPGMTGPELAEAATGRWPHLRIVLVTGYHNMQSPGWPMVWKPYDQRAIERVISEAD